MDTLTCVDWHRENTILFSWDGVEQGEWEDTDFLKDFEEKAVTVELKGSDTKAIELKLIQMKNTATARE